MGSLWQILVMGPLLVGVTWAFLKAVRGTEPELGDMFEGFRRYLDATVGMLLVTLAVVVGLIFLIVPGLILLVRFFFTPFLIIDRELSAVDAMKESWELTRGHGWSIFGLVLLAIPILIGGLLLLIVGVVPATVWIYASAAAFYQAVAGAPAPARPTGTSPGTGAPEPAAGP